MRLNIQSVLLVLMFLPHLHGVARTPYDEGAYEPPGGSSPVTAVPDTQVFALPFEVLITAPRLAIPLREIPSAASIVGEETLEKMPRGAAIDEALVLVPGVKVDNQANGERVHLSIRGQGILTETGIRSIKVLLDELPLNDPTGFVPDFFDVDFNTVDRIEVLRGPATSFYGGGAAGGIINIVTRNSEKVPASVELSTTTGSNGFWKGFGQFGGDAGEMNYRVSLSRTGGAGYRVHTHFWENILSAKATYTPTQNFQVTPVLSWSDTYHENPEGLSLTQNLTDPTLPNDDAIPYNEHMEMNRTSGGLVGVFRFLDDQEIHFSGYVRHSRYTEANNRVFDHQNLTTVGTSLQYTLSSGLLSSSVRNIVSAGLDLEGQTNDEHLNPNNYSAEGDAVLAKQQIRQHGTGMFLIDRIDFGNQWNVMGSLRLDKIRNELEDLLKTDSTDNSGSADFSNVTGRLGVTHSPRADMTLYAAWGQGFIPPSTEELGTNPGGYGGFNRSLTAATSNSFEAGVRGSPARILQYDVTAYSMTTRNDFDRYRIPNRGHGEEGTFYRNVGASRRYGLELWAQCRPMPMLNVQLAYTYSHFTYSLDSPIPVLMDDTTIHKNIGDGNWLPNSPQHQVTISAGYEVTDDLSVSMSVQSMSKSYIDGANIESEAARGYALIGGRIDYTWRLGGIAGTLSFQGRNLGDVRYVAFTEPDSGGNSYQPGPGREFFGGLRIRL